MSQESVRWVRSSKCEAHTCVEVARLPGLVLVRSSVNPERATLRVTHPQWWAFCHALRLGRLSRRPDASTGE